MAEENKQEKRAFYAERGRYKKDAEKKEKRGKRAKEEANARRETDENAQEICWGRNPVIASLKARRARCMKVFVSKSAQPHIKAKIASLCRAQGIIFQTVENAALDRLTRGENHQGVAAFISPIKLYGADDLINDILPKPPERALVVVLDHIQDPRNLGAVIRSSEAAGASAVIIPKRGGSLPTGTVVKTSAGAAVSLPIALVGNISQTIRLLQEAGFWVTGLTTGGRESLFAAGLPPRSAIVVGAEGEGLSPVVVKACDDTREIPIRGTIGSLNASVAAALAVFEWARSFAQNDM